MAWVLVAMVQVLGHVNGHVDELGPGEGTPLTLPPVRWIAFGSRGSHQAPSPVKTP